MNCNLVLWHSHFLAVTTRDVKKSLNGKWNICGVVKLILVWDLGICNLLKESLILINCHISLFTVPDSLERIHLLTIKSNRIADKLRELLNDLLNFALLRKFSAICSQLHNNLSSSIKVKILCIGHCKFSTSIRNPCYSLV